MDKNDIIQRLKNVYKDDTSPRYAYFDYLSLKYPIPINILSKYRYCWNYVLLCSNPSINELYRLILQNVESVFQIDIDVDLKHTRTTIDLTFSLFEILSNASFNELSRISEGLPPEYFMKAKDCKLFHKLLQGIITDLLDKQLAIWSDMEMACLQNYDIDFQKILPFSEEFIINNPLLWNWDLLPQNENISFSKEILIRFEKQINWRSLSGNPSILWTEMLIDKFKERIDWTVFSRTHPFTEHQLTKYARTISWEDIIHNKRFRFDSKSFLQTYSKELSHKSLQLFFSKAFEEYERLFKSGLAYRSKPVSTYPNTIGSEYIAFNTEHEISYRDQALKFIDWEFFCFSPPDSLASELYVFKPTSSIFNRRKGITVTDWSSDLLLVNKNKINWKRLLEIEKLVDIYKRNKDFRIQPQQYSETNSSKRFYDHDFLSFIAKLNWFHLSINKDLPWSKELLIIFEEWWNWDWISKNPSIPFTVEILREISEHINWENLSGLESTFWTSEILDEFVTCFNWKKLSRNKSLPWTKELIQRYVARWDWTALSENVGIPFNVDLISKFENLWNWEMLSYNESLSWTFELFNRFLFRWIFVSDLEPSTSEMRTRIFIGGVCGNLGFYEKVVLPLIGENIELLLGPSKLSGVKPSSEPDVKDKHHYVEESLQDFLDKHYHFEEPLQFGKYKGKSIKQIIDIDLSYIVWSIRKGIINTTSEAMSYLYSVLYSYHGVDKFLPQMDLLKSSRISSLDEMFDLEKSIYDEGSKDCDDNTDYFDSNMLDDALEGDPDNYWNID